LRQKAGVRAKKGDKSWAWWYTPVIPALRRLRQGNCELEASLGYIVSTCLKKEEEGGRKKDEGGEEEEKEEEEETKT
jgi:hypothetical protein